MKLAIIASTVALLATAATAHAQYGSYGNTRSNSGGLYGTGSSPNSVYVQPHSNSNGTSTQGHYRTTPNNTQRDNYGATGNYNPYTGNFGTRQPRY